MKWFKSVLTFSTLLYIFSAPAMAHSYSGSKCGGGSTPTPSTCTQSETYTGSFQTTDFSAGHSGKFYFGFDAISPVGESFQITEAYLTVNTSSNGYYDSIYAVNNGYWNKVGNLSNSGSDTFQLSSNLFDELLSGINFKAWFSLCGETISFAQLDIVAKYCPEVSEVPVPAAAFLFAPAMLGFVGLRRKTKNS